MSSAILEVEEGNPYEVVLSNGDRAEADSLEAIYLAARTLVADAQAAAASYYSKFTITFLYQGVCLIADVRSESL